jgi:hypothetical protein
MNNKRLRKAEDYEPFFLIEQLGQEEYYSYLKWANAKYGNTYYTQAGVLLFHGDFVKQYLIYRREEHARKGSHDATDLDGLHCALVGHR